MKKICIISFSTKYGLQKYMYSLYDVLKSNSKNVSLFTFGSSDISFKRVLDKNNLIFETPDTPGFEFKTFNIIEIKKILSQLKKIKCEYIYFYSSHVWNIPIIMKFKGKIKILHSIHDPFPHENEKNTRNVSFYNKFISKNVDYVILHNEKFKDKFSKKYNIDKSKVLVLKLWHEWLPYKRVKSTNKVLFFGRIQPYKGIEKVIKLAELNPNIIFNIVGKVSEEMEFIKKHIKECKNINLIDKYVDEDEMHQFFYESEIVILPYNSATQSGVLLEAYRHSRPIIAFDVGALSEQMPEHLKSEFLIKKDDLNDFNRVLNKYLKKNLEEKNKICKEFYNYGFSNFSAEKIGEKFLAMYSNI
ncbi:hypothetical protein LN42_06530 [Marinitoga sp. 1137]|uniref:glycosyltransferase family 4 protein n=1 Tax=Marinitoga sp. 1137 TaxID=1545835 RepID=UPI0009505306|nr:glycosyltransferase family 4 protein [Marinitoga sp. 1137]APT76072.1 hypothetical protein LN42_06530 [Marinitoga sp. 1137]